MSKMNNILWLVLMSVVENKHLQMLERRQYAVRQVTGHLGP